MDLFSYLFSNPLVSGIQGAISPFFNSKPTPAPKPKTESKKETKTTQKTPIGPSSPGYVQGTANTVKDPSYRSSQATPTRTYDTASLMPEVDPVTNILNTAVDSFKKAQDEYAAKHKDFTTKNPFNYDQVLAEEKTKTAQRLDPYYSQTLSDFLQGVTTQKTRSLEDERSLLTELDADSTSYEEGVKNDLTTALEQSREGAADAGLLSSGAALRSQGKLEATAQTGLADFNRKQTARKSGIELAGKRLREEDLPLQERIKKRDLAQEQSYNVESQSLAEAQRRASQYSFDLAQYTGAPPGADPFSFDTSSYNFLKG